MKIAFDKSETLALVAILISVSSIYLSSFHEESSLKALVRNIEFEGYVDHHEDENMEGKRINYTVDTEIILINDGNRPVVLSNAILSSVDKEYGDGEQCSNFSGHQIFALKKDLILIPKNSVLKSKFNYSSFSFLLDKHEIVSSDNTEDKYLFLCLLLTGIDNEGQEHDVSSYLGSFYIEINDDEINEHWSHKSTINIKVI